MKKYFFSVFTIFTLIVFTACEKQQMPEIYAGGKITKGDIILIDECDIAEATNGTIGLFIGSYDGTNSTYAELFFIDNYQNINTEIYNIELSVTYPNLLNDPCEDNFVVNEDFDYCTSFDLPACGTYIVNIEAVVTYRDRSGKYLTYVDEIFEFQFETQKSLSGDDIISEDVYACLKTVMGSNLPLCTSNPASTQNSNNDIPGIIGNGGGTTTSFLQIIPEPNKTFLLQEAF